MRQHQAGAEMIIPLGIGVALVLIALGSWPARRWPKTPKNVIQRNGQFRDS
jgi:hypothetical protein